VKSGWADESAYNLGVLYRKDRANDAEAERWWRHASALGHPGAKRALGILCYERDDIRGVKKWWLEAMRGGDQDALGHLETLRDE
jgi:TPR repeat protein